MNSMINIKYVYVIHTKYSDPILNNQNGQNSNFAQIAIGTILWSESKSLVL